MNSTTHINQPQQQQPVQITGVEKAKKEPPKIIEKVIESIEGFLTQPANQQTQKKTLPQKQQHMQPSAPVASATPTEVPAEEQDTQGVSTQYILPKGTTITLPDGQTFETQAESTLTKKGGE